MGLYSVFSKKGMSMATKKQQISNKEFLKKLLGTVVPSGCEQDIVKTWVEEAKKITKNVYVDPVGSAHAIINPNAKRKIVVVGHCDEIGLIIRTISDDGFLRVGAIGGWDAQVVIGQRVMIKTRKGLVFGVVGKKPIHKIEDTKPASKLKDLFIDIGATSKKDAEKMVEIGDSMVLYQGYIELQNNTFSCRGCDDKVGAFIALEVLRKLSKQKLSVAVEAIASVQEEVGVRGIKTAAYLAQADVGFAVDVIPTNDTPDSVPDAEVILGNGGVIARGPHINTKLFELLKKTAKTKNIDYQVEASGRPFGTDVEPLQLSRGGVVSALVSIPCRYLHSPSEMCSFEDVQSTINLLVETINKITPKTDFSFIG